MTREESVKKVKDILVNNNVYGAYHKQNFDTFSAYGENAPINSSILYNMPTGAIVLSEDVYFALTTVMDVTSTSYQEFPFFLYGKEQGNNNVVFDEFFSASSQRYGDQALFDDRMNENITNKVRNNPAPNLVVCHGHSHPPIGNYHQNFSLGDFASYVALNESTPEFKSGRVELTGCLVTSTGDINFVYYDNKAKNFYRYTNVYVREYNGNLVPVNCYGMNQGEPTQMTQ